VVIVEVHVGEVPPDRVLPVAIVSGCGRFSVAGPSNVTVIGRRPAARQHSDLSGAEVRERLEDRVDCASGRVERNRAGRASVVHKR
jgi:hypothetical protein